MITKEDLAEAILRLETAQEETNEQIKRTDIKLDKIAKLVGNISNNQGDIAEEFFYNSLEANPTLAGIEYDYIDKNITRNKKGLRTVNLRTI